MRVKYLPHQPHCFAFGGFDIQMLNTLKAVQDAGVNASKLDVWSQDKDFEILHVWGVGPHNFTTVDFAKKAGKLVIATVLVPYHDTLRSKLGYYYRFFRLRKMIETFGKIDKIIVLNNLQFKILHEYYKVSLSKMEIIPNIIEEAYFRIPDFDFKKKSGIENYVLCTGNICARKNQYNLALACINLNLNLVLIGNVLDGEILYGEKLAALAKQHANIRWIKELAHGSDELVSAYFNCMIYALPSKSETQPISALEAVAMKKSLVLLDRMYAYQSFYSNAILCKSGDVKSIEKGLAKAMNKKGSLEYDTEILNCKKEKVGNLYKDLYENL